MKIIEIVAEAIYLEDTKSLPYTLFREQDSNVRDFYFLEARDKLPSLMSGYFRQNGKFTRLLRGCIIDFQNQHGELLTIENVNSLVKRIVSRLPELLKQQREPISRRSKK